MNRRFIIALIPMLLIALALLFKAAFIDNRSYVAFSPESIGAPSLPIDEKVKTVTIINPKFVARAAYCYFEFRGWFDPSTLSPEGLSNAASGFAILKNETAGYDAWLDSNKGKACASRVKKYADALPSDLQAELGESVALIAINRQALKDKPAEEARREAILTINHERIHVLQTLCKDLDQMAEKLWRDLPGMEKTAMKTNYPAYNWADTTVAAREYLALTFETKPLDVLDLAKGCRY